jgi:type II secretory pathway pseudopilin PulG
MAELIIAIVIFAILAALSYGAYRQYNEALVTRSAANQVAADIALARSQAIKRRGNVSIVVDEPARSYVIRDDAGNLYKTRYFDDDSDLPLRFIETPSPDSITFNSRGFVVGTLIPVDVGRRNRWYRVTMTAVGRTQITKQP